MDLIFCLDMRSMSSFRDSMISGWVIPVCRLLTAETNEISPRSLSISIFRGYC